MASKKIKRIIGLILAGGAIIYIGVYIYFGIAESIKNPSLFNETPPNEYINLFNKKSLQKLQSKGTMRLKLRNTISYIIYDRKYNLELTKINVQTEFNPGRDIIEQNSKGDGDFSPTLVPWDESKCNTTYRSTSTDQPSKIYLALTGDSIKTILKNDSVACYYLKLKNVYVQYKPGGTYEITAQAKDELFFFSDEPPISLLFLKKHGSLYFFLMTVTAETKNLDPNLLGSLIKQ